MIRIPILRRLFIFIGLGLVLSCSKDYQQDRKMNRYLDSIRSDRAALQAFFRTFPKGGDLHHHFDGAVYAETYLDIAIRQNFFVDLNSLNVQQSPAPGFVSLKDYSVSPGWPVLREKLMQRWSVRNFQPGFLTPEAHFFNAFMGFIPIMMSDPKSGMMDIRNRAINEGVLYLESIFLPLPSFSIPLPPDSFNTQLIDAGQNKDTVITRQLLDIYFKELMSGSLPALADGHNRAVDSLHQGIDSEEFVLRYQNYIVRVFQPVSVFRDMVFGFYSAEKSPLIVGVNIVAPEDDPVTIRDYWLQMQMYKFCKEKFPSVRFAVHAGELTTGLVKPEELGWHVRAAVEVAGASRIGHGTDVSWDAGRAELFENMKAKDIPVEINLSSNEFLLGVSQDHHPVVAFHQAGVPIVLSTDDPGVLRNSLTDEFVLLAERYPELSYSDIKQISFNAIEHSHIEEAAVKEKLRGLLEARFKEFEKMW